MLLSRFQDWILTALMSLQIDKKQDLTHDAQLKTMGYVYPARRDCDIPIPVIVTKPYPLVAPFAPVIGGFGRGSTELGCPTANVDPKNVPWLVSHNDSETSSGLNDSGIADTGVYFGFARVRPAKHDTNAETILEIERAGTNGTERRNVEFNYGALLEKSQGDLEVLPAVLSVGLNPYYGNKEKTVEIHVLHKFAHSFYGADISFVVLGYIRPELDYSTLDALVKDINMDIDIATTILQKPGYALYKDLLL
ncbi:hypothetical protein TBLA_0H00460 [Henningerozyma blattae CBS 6284]|uniref:Riboflavin kinase n=1 Tax=Henningerozyma blattae (strain ATCC 34711 / CBS 6284 / DSM 70876 / NBRC 10599 / NRRL Y-10934 / UCD 77-7) TaxID=1071380 RepID=I2H7I7_HENB6|nr:hypothetical protein TBLA_0H00460 [Tetrapisispora blattae CBS 6284]CCH62339.1 hypothetical protein TBLA_0H00460 [Tetrapisispora blattae CBS 6284]